jgi:hypothetical protein
MSVLPTQMLLHIHVARLTQRGARHLTPQNAPSTLLYPPRYLDEEDAENNDDYCYRMPRNLYTTRETKMDDIELMAPQPRVLLLCLTGHVDRTFMERWTASLDSRFGSFWRDQTRFSSLKAILLLACGYLVICLPCAFVLIYLFQTHTNFWLWNSGLVMVGSFVLFRVYSFGLYKLHYFSTIENRVAFNINTQLATFFKQYAVCSMKPYSKPVPSFTVARLFLDSHQLTFTTLTYQAPKDEAVLIPSACEAIDTLRAKRNSKCFVNIVIVTTAGNAEHMQSILEFCIRSTYQAYLSPDKTLLLCVWGHKRISMPMHLNPVLRNDCVTLMPLVFTIPAIASVVDRRPSAVVDFPPTTMLTTHLLPHNRAFRKVAIARPFYRRFSEVLFSNPPITPSKQVTLE